MNKRLEGLNGQLKTNFLVGLRGRACGGAGAGGELLGGGGGQCCCWSG